MIQTMNKAGFSLVEVLMVTVVLLLIGGAGMAMSQVGPSIWVSTGNRLASLTNAQRALDRVVRDLRAASAATLNCAPAAPNDLTFTQVENGVQTVVNYDHSGTLLLKNGQAVAGAVTAFRPTCFPDGRVAVQVTVQVDASTARTLASQVWVRQP